MRQQGQHITTAKNSSPQPLAITQWRVSLQIVERRKASRTRPGEIPPRAHFVLNDISNWWVEGEDEELCSFPRLTAPRILERVSFLRNRNFVPIGVPSTNLIIKWAKEAYW